MLVTAYPQSARSAAIGDRFRLDGLADLTAVGAGFDREGRMRDRALFDLAIDRKLRGRDLVKLKIGHSSPATTFELERWSSSRRLDDPCSSKLRPRSEPVCLPGFSEGEEQSMTMPFPVASTTLIISALGNTPDWLMSG